MATAEMIRTKMQQAATTTLGEVCDVERVEDEGALSALVASRIVSFVLQDAQFSLEGLPLAPMSRQIEMQLDVLWQRYQAPGADREAIVGALDRIVAELYGLTTSDLMGFERAVEEEKE